MKTIEEIFQTRTSVRRYERKTIEPEKLEFIYKAIQNTPTSYNGQQLSVIAVSDQTLKEQLYSITGQKQIKTCAIFLIFCIDFNKIKKFADTLAIEFPRFQDTLDGLLVGVIDAALAMQNAVIAAESLDLGSCCIGYTRTAAPAQLADILQLPEGVAVVCGLSIGYPSEHPDLKPKQPLSLLIHHNHYRSDDSQIVKDLMAYNNQIQHFNEVRTGDKTHNDWGTHILDYYQKALGYNLEEYFDQQGFHLFSASEKH
ncbi:nitroreductase family protein [Microbacter margulisiae]|uniref:Nitroreductase n=1 Tax=Microbacter margulisiae TaxID=1350067 RepID=A0A7W5DRZ2_9PORP|nr:nitroreductase family protein [Microbacter margulisiae]MBB3187987.1 nitroreductase [Microbacter margulisiae]